MGPRIFFLLLAFYSASLSSSRIGGAVHAFHEARLAAARRYIQSTNGRVGNYTVEVHVTDFPDSPLSRECLLFTPIRSEGAPSTRPEGDTALPATPAASEPPAVAVVPAANIPTISVVPVEGDTTGSIQTV